MRQASVFRTHSFRRSTLAAIWVILAVTPGVASAAEITVTTTDDEINSDGDCSLREAIEAANSDAAVDNCTAGSGTDTIRLPSGTITIALTNTAGNEASNQTGDFDIISDVTIAPTSASTTTTIDASGIDRIFDINGATVVLERLILINGAESDGAVIRSKASSLDMTDVAIRGGLAGCSKGGGLYHEASATGHTLTCTRCEISGNSAGEGGGVAILTTGTSIAAMASFSNSTFAGNAAASGSGCATTKGTSLYVDLRPVQFDNVTVGTTDASASVFEVKDGDLSYKNSILVGDASIDGSGSLNSNDYNIVFGTGYSLNTNDANADPGLLALASNTGLTQTMAPTLGSIALGTGSCQDSSGADILLDQTGDSRPASACDIGAFEGRCETAAGCSDGIVCTTDVCTPVTGCTNPNASTSTECGTASGECKNAPVCDGFGSCAAETNKNDGDPCGNLTDTTCDGADTCLSGTCASNFASTSTECGTASGECKNAPVCDGSGGCAAETNKNDGDPCGNLTDTTCNGADTCLSGTCESNFASTSTECGTASSDCANAPVCDGSGNCAAETNKASGIACDDGNACRLSDTCDGAGVCAGSTDKCFGTGTTCDTGTGVCTCGSSAFGSNCELQVTQTSSGSAVAGSTWAIPLTALNLDSANVLTNVSVELVLSANLSFSNATGTSGVSCTENSGTVTCDFGSIGASLDKSVTVNLTVSGTASGSVSAAITGSVGAVSGNSSSITASAGVGVDIAMSATLTAAHATGGDVDSDGLFEPGDTVTYTATITNSGSSTAVSPTFALTLDSNVTLVGGSVNVDGAGSGSSVGSLSIGDVAAGSSTSVTFDVTVNNPFPISTTQISHQATISGGTFSDVLTDDSNTEAVTDATVTTISAAPNLFVTKSTTQSSVAAGTVVNYTIQYKNCGTQAASGVTITETVPQGTNFTTTGSSSWSGCSDGAAAGTTCTFSHSGDLAADCSTVQTLTFATTLTSTLDGTDTGLFPGQATCATGCVQNTVSITDDGSNGADEDSSDNSLTLLEPTLAAAPDVQVAVTPNITANATNSDLILYTVTYGNIGTQDASSFTIQATIPASTTSDPNNTDFTCSTGVAGDTCSYTVSSLAQGTTGVAITFAVRVSDTLTSSVTSLDTTIAASESQTELRTDNNSVPVSISVKAAPDLTVSKSHSDGAATNGLVMNYQIVYTNQGTADSIGVVLNETVPTNATHTPQAGDTLWTCNGAEIAAGQTAAAGSTCTYSDPSTLPSASGSNTRTVNFRVTLGDSITSATTISNTVTIEDSSSANPSELDESNNSDTDTTNAQTAPDLAVSLSTSTTEATVSTAITYTIGYSNDGTTTAFGTSLSTTLPNNTTYTGSNGWTCDASNCTLTIGDLAQGASGTVDFQVEVDSTLATTVTSIDNTVTITDDDTAGGHVAELVTNNNTASLSVPVSGEADLQLSVSSVISGGGTEATPGDTITYTIGYTNAGTQTAFNAVLTSVIPTNTTFQSAGSDAFQCLQGNTGGLSCTLTIDTITAGATGQVTFVVQVDGVLSAAATSIAFSPSIDAGVDLDTADNSASDTIAIASAPDVSIISVTDNANALGVSAGDTILYSITYGNLGTADAADVNLVVTLPNDSAFNSSQSTASGATWSCDATTCTLAIGALTQTETSVAATLAIDVSNPLSAVASLSGSMQISVTGGLGFELDSSNNSFAIETTVRPAADLQMLTTDGPTTVGVGEIATYTLNYNNLGTASATGVTLTETVPANTTFAEFPASDTGWSCANGGVALDTCTYTVGNLAVSDPRSTKFAVTVASALLKTDIEISNTATINLGAGDAPELDASNNSASITTPVTATPDLIVQLSSDATSVQVEQQIVYTITYQNDGTADATNVTLSISEPTGTAFVSGQDSFANTAAATWSCASGTCSLNVGTLTFGTAATTVTFTVQVGSDLSAVGSAISNSVSVSGDAAQDLDSSDNSATLDISLASAPDLALSVAGDLAIVESGFSPLRYTATFNNQDATAASGAQIVACLPSVATASSSGNDEWSCTTPDGSAVTCPFSVPTSPSAYDTYQTCTRTIGTIAGNASSVTVDLFVDVSGQLTKNDDTIPVAMEILDGSGLDLSPADNIGRADVTVAPGPHLQLTKTTDTTQAAVATNISYTLTATNVGTATSSGVVITETVPANTTFNPDANDACWSCSVSGVAPAGTTCTCAVGTLIPDITTVTRTFVVLTDATLQDVSSITNTATIADDGLNGTDLNTGGTDRTATYTVQAQPSPDLAVSLATDVTTAAAGASVTYTATCTNTGTAAGQNAALTLCLGDNLTPDATNTAFTCSVPTSGTCALECTTQIADIGIGSTTDITFVALVAAVLPDTVTSVSASSNIIDGVSSDLDDSDNTSSSVAVTLTGAPDLVVTYQNSPTSSAPGGTLSFTLQYENIGTQVARNVVLTQPLPSNTVLDSASSPGWTCLDGSCTFSVDPVQVDGTHDVPFVVIVENPLSSGVASTSASVSIADDGSNGTDLNTSDNSAQVASITLTGAANNQLSVVSTPTVVAASSALTYQISYWNEGDQDATDVEIKVELDSLVIVDTAASTPSGWSCSANSASGGTDCTLALGGSVDLPGGGTAASASTATLAVTLVAELPADTASTQGTFTISDSVDAGVADSTSTLTVTVDAAPDLLVTQTASTESTVPGGIVVFNYDVGNVGTEVATDVTLSFTIPNNTVFDPTLSEGWSCCTTQPCDDTAQDYNPGSTCIRTIGTVNVNETVSGESSLVTVVNPLPAGIDSITNIATVAESTATSTDANPSNDQSTKAVTVDGNPAFTITMSDEGVTKAPGETITYTIAAQNTGDQDATGVTISLELSSSVTYTESGSTSGWTCQTSSGITTCDYDYSTLSAGAQNTDIVLVTTINSPLTAGVTQISTAATISDDGANHSGGILSVTSATVTTSLSGTSDVTLTYSASESQEYPGGSAAYALTYTNSGDVGLSNVDLAVTVPSNATFDTVASDALVSSTGTWSCDNSADPVVCTLSVGDIAGGGGTGTANFVLELATISTAAADGGSDIASVTADLVTAGSTDSLATATATTNIARCALEWRFETSGQGLSVPTQNPSFEYVSNGQLGGGYWRTGGDNLLVDTADAKLEHLNLVLDIPAEGVGGESPVIEIAYVLAGQASLTKDFFGFCIGSPSDTGISDFSCDTTTAIYDTADNTPVQQFADSANGIQAYSDNSSGIDIDYVVVDVSAYQGQQVELSMFYQTSGADDTYQGVAILEVRQYSDADNDDVLDGSSDLCDVCWDKDNDGYFAPLSPALVSPDDYTTTCSETTVDCNDAISTLNVSCDEDCADIIDNNEDGLADCADTECSSDPFCDPCQTTFTFDTGEGAWVSGGLNDGGFVYRDDSSGDSGWELNTPLLVTGGSLFTGYIYRDVAIDAGMPSPELLVKYKIAGAVDGKDRIGVCLNVTDVSTCLAGSYTTLDSADSGDDFSTASLVTQRLDVSGYKGSTIRIQIFFDRFVVSDETVQFFIDEVSVLSDIDLDGVNGDPDATDGLSPYENTDATCDRCIDKDGDGYGGTDAFGFNDSSTCGAGFTDLDCNDDPDADGANYNTGIAPAVECATAGDQNCDGVEDANDGNCSLCGNGIVTAGEECDDGSPCDESLLAEGETCTTPVDGDGCSSTCQLEVDAGRLFISEIHVSQVNVNQQWVELYNNSNAIINLSNVNLKLSNNTSGDVLFSNCSLTQTSDALATAEIAPNSFYVIGLGSLGTLAEANAFCLSQIKLDDNGDVIELIDSDADGDSIIDVVDFSTTSDEDFSCARQHSIDSQNDRVRSIELIGVSSSSATSNDTPGSWCISGGDANVVSINGSSDVHYGSPGAQGSCFELDCDGIDDDCDGTTDSVVDDGLTDSDGDFVCDDTAQNIDCDPNNIMCNVDCSDSDNDGTADCADGCIDPDGDGYGTPGNNPDRLLQCKGCRNPQAECTFCANTENAGSALCAPCYESGTTTLSSTTTLSRCLPTEQCALLPTLSCPGVTCTNPQADCITSNCPDGVIDDTLAECAACSSLGTSECTTSDCDAQTSWCTYCKTDTADSRCDVCDTAPETDPVKCATDCSSAAVAADVCGALVCDDPQAVCEFCQANPTDAACDCAGSGLGESKCADNCFTLSSRQCSADTCLSDGQTCDCNESLEVTTDASGAEITVGMSVNVEQQEGADGTCTDALDNDCDGLTDCSDSDCSGDAACQGSTCAEALSVVCGVTQTVTPASADLPCADGVDSVLRFTANATEFLAEGTHTVTVRVENSGSKAFGAWVFAPQDSNDNDLAVGEAACPENCASEFENNSPGVCQQTQELTVSVEANKVYTIVLDEVTTDCASSGAASVSVTVLCAEDCSAIGDEDADGLSDCADDNCVSDAACSSFDYDSDGVSNEQETICNTDPEIASDTPTAEDLSDTDADGTLNCADDDDDGDGLPDSIEEVLGTDTLLYDTDGDGLSDGAEDANGNGIYEPATETSPLLPDSDGDQLPDGLELSSCYDVLLDGVTCVPTNPLLVDTDEDGLPDGTEDANQNGKVDDGETNPTIKDSDGDKYSDGREQQCNTDPLDGKKTPTFIIDGDTDEDGDGVEDGECDGLKTDSDGDGIADGVENLCGTDYEDPNSLPSPADLENVDGDELIDCIDPDDDDDAVPDIFEEICGTDSKNDESTPPLIDVLDTDGDGFRNCQDADDDGDGVVDVDEALIGTDQYDADSDDDGLFDGAERDSHLTDPTVFDTDGDGLSDGLELGMTEAKLLASSLGGDTDRFVFVPDQCPETKTDPTRSDTDDDGLGDGAEDLNQDGCVSLCATDEETGLQIDPACTNEFDPNNQNDVEFDADGDGLSDLDERQIYLTDPKRADSDGDGLSDGGEVLVFKTNPLVADTDKGGVNDGDEVANRSDPLDPDDDFSLGKLASGNESSCGIAHNSNQAAIWLLLGLMAWLTISRRLRKTWLILLAIGLTQLVATPAQAQSTRVDAVNVFGFLPVGGQYRHWSVEQSLISPHLKPYGSVLFHLENDSLTLITGSSRESLVDFAAFADLNIGIGLYDWVAIEAALPVALALRSGTGVQSVAVQSGAGLGDLIVRVRTRLLSNKAGGVGLALTTGLVVPTGDGDAFRGDEGFSVIAGLIADFRTTSTVTSLNIGTRIRTFSSQFFDTVIDHDLNFGLGFDINVWRNWVTIGTEVFGRTSLLDPFGTKENTSMEFLAGPKVTIFEGFSWQVAFGAGLVRGRGTPQYRFVSGFAYAPRIQDSDGDGIIERADACPLDKEDLDDFRDADGCPDNDNDGDGIDDIADRCPSVPEDSNGIESADGCPDSDQDGDGIVDVYDRCPYASEDHDGFQDDDGCPERDNDSDSILDVYDACPNVAETYNGLQDDDGCPDATPKVAALPCSPKCSFSVQKILRFDEREPRLSTVHRRFLDELAEKLLQNQYVSEVKVTGYAWDEGSRAESKKLARQRAEYTVEYLVGRGVPRVLLTAHDIFHDASLKPRGEKTKSLRPAERELTPEQRRYRASNPEDAAEMRRVTFKVVMNARCGTGRTGPACGRTEPDPELPTPPLDELDD
jgi:CSLREA domain-containing protein/uncharacterized repeat protein (TIGR01451 family)